MWGKDDSLLHTEILGGVRFWCIFLVTVTLKNPAKPEKCRKAKKNSRKQEIESGEGNRGVCSHSIGV